MSLLATLAFALQVTAASAPTPELRGEDLMKALQSGGYTILLRHARTDRSYQEAMGTVPAERSAQRNLSADGVRDAALMGVVLRKYRIPIGEIVSSPMYRTRETAEYAARTPTTITMALRVFPSTDETAAVVAAPPAPGTNRLLVTHHFVIEKYVPGIRPGDIGESEAAIVRPAGEGRITLVGRITLSDWERLANVAPPSVTTAASATTSTVVLTASPTEPVTIASLPVTRAGRLARRYLEAFNSRDTTRMRLFIESSLLPNPDRPLPVRLQSYLTTFETLGPIAVTGLRASSADEITLVARAKNGDIVLTVRASAEEPARAESITIGTTRGAHP